MGIAYRCDTETGLCVSVWAGAIHPDEPRAYIARLAADPEYATARFLVTDLTRVADESRPSPEQVADLAAVFLRHLARRIAIVKWAMIADRAFEEAVAFETHIGHEIRRMIVFNSLGPASIWMGLDPMEVRTVVDSLREELRAA